MGFMSKVKGFALVALITFTSFFQNLQCRESFTFCHLFFDINNQVSENCSIDIRKGLNRTSAGSVREPLFLKYSGNAYKLMIPETSGELKFKSGENALVACTSDNKPNSLTFSKHREYIF